MTRWPSCPPGSPRLTLERAERGLPVVKPVIEALHALQRGVGLEGLADFEDAVHAGGVPGAAELVEGLDRVVAGGFGVVLGSFDGGQVAEDDAASPVACDRRIVQDGEQGEQSLRQRAELAPVSAVPLLNRLLADVRLSSGVVHPRLVAKQGGSRHRRR